MPCPLGATVLLGSVPRPRWQEVGVTGMEVVKGAKFLLGSVPCALGPRELCTCPLRHPHKISFFSVCPHPNPGNSNPGQVLGGEELHIILILGAQTGEGLRAILKPTRSDSNPVDVC